MALVKFSPDRQPRRGEGSNAEPAAMTVWAVLLALVDWLNTNYVKWFVSGLATVGVGNTFIDVTHGLGNPSYRVTLTPNGADPTLRYWVLNKTATQFRISLSGAAPAGGVSFDWIVRGE